MALCSTVVACGSRGCKRRLHTKVPLPDMAVINVQHILQLHLHENLLRIQIPTHDFFYVLAFQSLF